MPVVSSFKTSVSFDAGTLEALEELQKEWHCCRSSVIAIITKKASRELKEQKLRELAINNVLENKQDEG